MAYRLLVYMVGIWEQYWKQYPKAKVFPLIFPIVFSQGEQRWSAPMNLHECLKVPDFMKAYVPNFTYGLLDIHEASDEELWEKVSLVAVRSFLSAMKHINSEELMEFLRNQMVPFDL